VTLWVYPFLFIRVTHFVPPKQVSSYQPLQIWVGSFCSYPNTAEGRPSQSLLSFARKRISCLSCAELSATICCPMHMHLIGYIFWCAPPMVMIVIAAYMLRSRLHRDFPVFFNYIVFHIASFAVEFPLRNWANYYYVYWVITALGIFFNFAVVVELVQKVAGATKTLRHRYIALLCWCALVLVAAVTAVRPYTSPIDIMTNGIFLVYRTVCFTQFALAVFMVLFGGAVGISKHNLVFGITAGFGFFALVDLLVMISLSHASVLSRAILTTINSASYVMSTLIWLAYVAWAAKGGSSNGSRAPA
jgi:hypothetical protein